jgi:hypothetical protein
MSKRKLTRVEIQEEIRRLEEDASKLKQDCTWTANLPADAPPSLRTALVKWITRRSAEDPFFGGYTEDMWDHERVALTPQPEDLYGAEHARAISDHLKQLYNTHNWTHLEVEPTRWSTLLAKLWFPSIEGKNPHHLVPELMAAATPLTPHVEDLLHQLEPLMVEADRAKRAYDDAVEAARTFAEKQLAPALVEAVVEHHKERALKKSKP